MRHFGDIDVRVTDILAVTRRKVYFSRMRRRSQPAMRAPLLHSCTGRERLTRGGADGRRGKSEITIILATSTIMLSTYLPSLVPSSGRLPPLSACIYYVCVSVCVGSEERCERIFNDLGVFFRKTKAT